VHTSVIRRPYVAFVEDCIAIYQVGNGNYLKSATAAILLYKIFHGLSSIGLIVSNHDSNCIAVVATWVSSDLTGLYGSSFVVAKASYNHLTSKVNGHRIAPNGCLIPWQWQHQGVNSASYCPEPGQTDKVNIASSRAATLQSRTSPSVESLLVPVTTIPGQFDGTP
jgi:hypothetical protein